MWWANGKQKRVQNTRGRFLPNIIIGTWIFFTQVGTFIRGHDIFSPKKISYTGKTPFKKTVLRSQSWSQSYDLELQRQRCKNLQRVFRLKIIFLRFKNSLPYYNCKFKNRRAPAILSYNVNGTDNQNVLKLVFTKMRKKWRKLIFWSCLIMKLTKIVWHYQILAAE
jgi:hypothetical protein